MPPRLGPQPLRVRRKHPVTDSKETSVRILPVTTGKPYIGDENDRMARSSRLLPCFLVGRSVTSCPALTWSLPFTWFWPAEDEGGVGVGQHRRCPTALRLPRTRAGQHRHLGLSPCGHRAQAAAAAGESNPLSRTQWASMARAPRGPPGEPAELPPPATASSTNQTT